VTITIHKVDFKDEQHGTDLIYLLDHYAQDEAGGGQPLSESVKKTLVSNLDKLPHAISLLAYDDDKPVGLLNAFEGFSTFANEPLINIHDLVVLKEHRGQGIAQELLAVIEEVAKVKGCCKLTLEVLEGNSNAKTSYQRFGFEAYTLKPEKGQALFWQKDLN
jgi:GNAT superfamily N-acetyltransferase